MKRESKKLKIITELKDTEIREELFNWLNFYSECIFAHTPPWTEDEKRILSIIDWLKYFLNQKDRQI